VCASVSVAHGGTVSLDNGVPAGEGHYDVQTDDFGSFGTLVGSNFNDFFFPQGVPDTFAPTYMTGVYLSVTTPGAVQSRVMLSDYRAWKDKVEAPPQPDAIEGAHTALTRTVTTDVAATSTTQATSAFAIEDIPSGLLLDFDLVQTILPGPQPVSTDFTQVYTITNNGTAAVDVVFSVQWDIDLYYTDNSSTNELVGVGPGFCSVYEHDPGSSVLGIALGDGGSTVPMAYYFGGKDGFLPDPAGPPFASLAANTVAEQYAWLANGIPPTWRNNIANLGYDMVGDSGTLDGDALIGTEYRFSMAPGSTETIHLLRRYGSIAIPCPAVATCGNGQLDAGEVCDGADTADCNGATCTASSCGDAYVNSAAGEDCESAGVDSDTCNGTLCTAAACGDGYVNAAAGEQCDDAGETAACNIDCTPSSCGDGHVNVAAGEECETGALCDIATCRVTYSLGGGCAGCGSAGDGRGTLSFAVGLVVVSALRRRRRSRTR
jgi:hypothetical protein